MSLKNIILKTGAASIAVSIIFGNCSMFGLGLSKVIAENLKAPEIEANLTNQKYVQYEAEEYSGVALQTELEVNSVQEQDSYLPVLSSNLEVKLPNINGYLPERANVVKASTEATTGQKENANINQNYDSNSGLLSVSYENTPNDEGEIYTEFNKDAKDEFEIIYIYPAEAYIGNEEEIILQYTVNEKMSFKTESGEVSSEKTQKFELKEKDNKGDITTFNVTELKENIYKGFLYSNVENKTNYDTEYKTVSTLCVLNSQVMNEMTMELKESKFVLDDEDKIEKSTKGTVAYKATGINQLEFDKILGQDGSLEIYNGETLLGTVKYIEVNEDKETVKKLAVIYSEEDIKILSDEETSAVVEYKEDVTSLKIKTTKPISEGLMNFENQNTIKAAKDYGVEIEDIEYIRVLTSVNTYNSKTDIKLLEPQTKINVNSSNTNFSTLQTSKTTLTVKLDDTNASTKLFNNPTITIKLPDGLTGGKLSSPEILNGNGLKLKDAKANKNIITLELEGKQTVYDTTNVSGGVSIVMDIENIDFSDITPTHTDKIEVSCKQGEDELTTSCDVNIVSKNGLLMITSLTGYNNKETITTMDSTLKTITVEKEEKEKILTENINIVNNYEDAIENINILGRLQYSDKDTTSTFTSKLNEIIVDGAKVYYSEKEDASYDDASWTEKYSSVAKTYKIVIDKLEKQSSKNIKVNIVLPANLGYNASEYLKNEIRYTYNSSILTTSSIIGLETEKIQNRLTLLSAETAQLNIDTHVESGAGILENKAIVYEGQVLKYVTSIQNTTNNIIENIVIKANIPEGTTYVKMKEDAYCEEGYFDEDASIKEVSTKPITLKPNETYTLEYEVRVNSISKEASSIKQNAYVYINGEENYSNTIESILYKAEAQVNMKFLIPDINSLHGGETAEISIELKNLTSKRITGKLDLIFSEYNNIGDIKYITYIKDANTQEISEREMYPDNIVIDANQTIYLTATIDIKDIEDQSLEKTKFKMTANFTVDNKTYTSNSISKDLLQSKAFLTAGLEGYVNDTKLESDATIENKTNITYKLDIKNTGIIDAERTQITDKLPEGVVARNIRYTQYIKTENGYETEEINEELDDETNIIITELIPSQKTLTIYITCYLDDEDVYSINNIVEIEAENAINIIKTNEVIYNIQEVEVEVEEEEPEDIEDIENDENLGNMNDLFIKDNVTDLEDSENPDGSTDVEQPDISIQPEDNKYSISGIAWLDVNKNGQRDSEEKLMDSVIITLVNKDTGNFATDDSGKRITATTNSNGEYKFENVKEGNYLVLFEFDTNTYTVTTYQKADVEQNLNSDAIISSITVNGEKKLAGITDNVTLNSNKENVDIGLIENATFDLSLDKQITKVTVINSQGTEEFEYEEGETAKVDLVAKYINSANVVVNYKFTITNEGDTVAYVDSLVDNLPSGLEFSSELNKDWYKGSDGSLYTTSLSGIAIKPGESTQVELVLTKNMTEDNTGVFVNNAELEKISNLENIQEKQEALENNKSSANLVISIKTGSVMLYTGITLGCILIIAVGAYIIKKKILDKGI